MYEHIKCIGIIVCDVYLGEAVAPRAMFCRAFQLSHVWALLFALRDPSAPWSGLRSNPGGTGDTELLLLGGDSSWHPWCKGTQSTALKGKVLLKGCQALLDYMSLLTAGFFLLCVWGLPTCASSQTEVAPLTCSCWTRAVLWPLPGRWLYLIELVDSITVTNNIKYIFFLKASYSGFLGVFFLPCLFNLCCNSKGWWAVLKMCWYKHSQLPNPCISLVKFMFTWLWGVISAFV